jgi:hypothetical protein
MGTSVGWGRLAASKGGPAELEIGEPVRANSQSAECQAPDIDPADDG